VSAQPNKSSASYPLISRERAQKLDLLNHLIANLAQTIVVCGPEGIGKTRLLTFFQESKTQSSMMCYVRGDSKLGMSEIENAMHDEIAENLPDLKSQALNVALDRINSRGAKVVLVLDDAGLLVPGLIEKVIAFGNSQPALKVVLALTHCELYLKNITDPVIDDCYLIEIPPLSPAQCEDYLEFLSTMPTPRIEFNRINDAKVAELFRESHGVPGKILALLPQPDNKKTTDYSKPVLISAVIGLVLLALGVQWWSAYHKTEVTPVTDKHAVTAKPQPNSPQQSVANTKNPPITTAITTPGAAEQKPLPNPVDKPITTEAPALSQKLENGQVSPSTEKPLDNSALQPAPPLQEAGQINAEAGINLGKGDHWLMAQPGENYTLQLMALSKEQAILDVLQRHPELGDELRYLKTKTRRGNDRFVLFYGSYANPEQIKADKQKLPKEFQKIWVRKIADFQKEIETKAQTQPPILTE
jgi:DamX protein